MIRNLDVPSRGRQWIANLVFRAEREISLSGPQKQLADCGRITANRCAALSEGSIRHKLRHRFET